MALVCGHFSLIKIQSDELVNENKKLFATEYVDGGSQISGSHYVIVFIK